MKKLSIMVLLLAVSVSAVLAPISSLTYFSLVCIEDPLKVFALQQQPWNFLVSKETASVSLEILFSDIVLYPIYLLLRGRALYTAFLVVIAWILSLSAYYLVSKISRSSIYGVIAGIFSTAWLLFSLQHLYNIHMIMHVVLLILVMALATKCSETRSFFLYVLIGVLAGYAAIYDIYLGFLCALSPLLFSEKRGNIKYYALVIIGFLPFILTKSHEVDQRLLCYNTPGAVFSDFLFLAVVLFSLIALHKRCCWEARGLLLIGGLLGLMCLTRGVEIYLWYFSALSVIFLSFILGAFDRDVVSRTTALIIIQNRVAKLKIWFSLGKARVSFLTIFLLALATSAIFMLIAKGEVKEVPRGLIELRYKRISGAVLWIPRSLYKEYYLNAAILPYAPALGPSLSKESLRYEYLSEVISEKRCLDLPFLLYSSGVSIVAVLSSEAELLSDYLSEAGLQEIYAVKEISIFSTTSKRVRFAKTPLLVLGDCNFLDTLPTILRDYNISWESAPPVVFVRDENCLKIFNESPLIFYNCDYRALALELYLSNYDTLSEKNADIRGLKALVLKKGEEYEISYFLEESTKVHVWAKVLLNASGGVLKIKIGERIFEVTTERKLVNPVYLWIKLGKVSITKPSSSIKLKCVKGECVLSKLIVVPEEPLIRAFNKAKEVVKKRGFFYVFDGEYCFNGTGFRYGVDEDYHRRALLCPPFHGFKGLTEVDVPLSGHYRLTFIVSRVPKEVFVSYGVFGTKFFSFDIPLGLGYTAVTYETEAKEGLHKLFLYVLNNKPQCIYLDYILIEPANASLADYLRRIFSYTFSGRIISESSSEIVIDLSEDGVVVLHEDFSENWIMVLSNGKQVKPIVCDLGVCCFKASAGRAKIIYKSAHTNIGVLKSILAGALLALAGLGDMVRIYGRRR